MNEADPVIVDGMPSRASTVSGLTHTHVVAVPIGRTRLAYDKATSPLRPAM